MILSLRVTVFQSEQIQIKKPKPDNPNNPPPLSCASGEVKIQYIFCKCFINGAIFLVFTSGVPAVESTFELLRPQQRWFINVILAPGTASNATPLAQDQAPLAHELLFFIRMHS